MQSAPAPLMRFVLLWFCSNIFGGQTLRCGKKTKKTPQHDRQLSTIQYVVSFMFVRCKGNLNLKYKYILLWRCVPFRTVLKITKRQKQGRKKRLPACEQSLSMLYVRSYRLSTIFTRGTYVILGFRLRTQYLLPVG